KLDVSNKRLHFRRLRRQRAPVHAPRHAGVDSILNADFMTRAGAVAREFMKQSKYRQSEFFRPGMKMAVTASKIVAGVALGGIRHFRTDVSVSGSEQIPATTHQTPVFVVGQCPDFGNGPDGTGWCACRLRRPWRWDEHRRKERNANKTILHWIELSLR